MSKGPAPQFRPRGRTLRSPRRRWIAIGAAAGLLTAVVAAVAVLVLVVMDDEGDPVLLGADSGPSESTGGSSDQRLPRLAAPASQFVLQSQDITGGYHTYVPDTYQLSPLSWASQGHFKDPEAGEQQAIDWGYLDGYQSSFEPNGQLADVVRGSYYVEVESVIFDTLDGAVAAYEHLKGIHASLAGSQAVEAKQLGNESSAWKAVSGTVGPSELPAVYHRFIFRRGNLVSIVQTYGADKFMKIDFARNLAIGVDQKALGERAAPTPTPGSSGILPTRSP